MTTLLGSLCATWTRNVQAALEHRSDIQIVLYSNDTRIRRFTATEATRQWKALITTGEVAIPVRDIRR